MAQNGIALSRPALGGVVSSMSPSVIIAPANATRPYIMGSIVTGTIPTPNKQATKVVIKAGQIKGVMCLGTPQVQQRGKTGIVREGFSADYNNFGTKGAFWCALDLKNFDKSKVDALTDNGVLSVDSNGVLSYGENNPAGNTQITGANIAVLNYYDTAIIGATNETVSVGQTNYTFAYPNGIGAILVVIS